MKQQPEAMWARWAEGMTCIRQRVSMPQRIVLGAIPIVVILLLWQWATYGATVEDRWISSAILPSPLEVLGSWRTLWFHAELSRSILASGIRVVVGFAIALAIAFPLGVLMGSFVRVRALFSPLVTMGAYLPIPTLVPLTMSLFGIDEKQKFMFLALAFIIFLLPLILASIDEVDEIFIQTAQTLGASKFQIVRHVLLGISMTGIFDAMRLGFGVGWTYIILAEMVAADRGLGHIIIIAQRIGPREHVYLVLFVIIVIAFITDKIWVKLGNFLFPYRVKE